jgi:hypothetical protein
VTPSQDVPLLQVVRGEPTAEELAALVAVVAARASAFPEPTSPVAPSLWGRPVLRAPVHPGPGAWRASGLPG